MPLTIPREFQPFLRDGDNAITATDARSLAYDGQFVFTSPNMTFVPQLYDNPSNIVQARADGKFWAMDPFQWPQMYADAYTWSFTIPRREFHEPGTDLWYAWWSPVFSDDFEPLSPGHVFGKLKSTHCEHLFRLYERANKRVGSYKLFREHKQDAVVGWVTGLRSVYERFKETLAWRDIVMILAEFQRRFLEIWSMVDYLEIFEPRLKFEDKEHGVNKTWMGCFTKDSAIALRLHKAGVPVWLIRDVRLVDNKINIRQVVPFTPADLVFGMYLHPIKNFAQPFDIRYKGPSDHQRQAAVRQPYLTFEEIPVDQTEVNCLAVSREPSSGKAPAKKMNKSTTYEPTALRQNQSQVGRDKWADVVHPSMPSINTFFASAMSQAEKDSSRVKPTHARMDEGYRLPNPGLFVNILSSQSLKKYLANWLACRESWLKHVYVSPPSPLPRSQNWRDLLIMQPTPQPSSSSGQMPSGKTGKSKAKLGSFFGDELSLLRQFWAGSQILQWRGQKIEAATLENPPHRLVQEIIYEICEQSFRYDLLELDERLARHMRRDREARKCRMDLLRGIFPQHSLTMWDKDFSTRNDGLNAESFQDALAFFEKFRQVLIAWEGAPQDLKQPFTESMPEGEKWQRMKQCALFYVQSFYDNTGRPPVVPHMLYVGA
ncbi:uncharacterized protein HD556DRAFT_1461353 [Suillus plorans]|uniref:Uncharacterized protein n=1 Tax=Suillus plorans TaxID=116603 RepID=A0A9P7DAM9_9AGAM|nr:uncharacterized protein HD556DRAFT_1461353 [Suillus plorans]KAG1784801.1 hypothetical protein HD556DRAFT_1461353 [Suillus plorans]